MDLAAQPLDISTLHNVYVVEELIQLTVGSDKEIIARTGPKILCKISLLNTLQAAASVLNTIHDSEP